MHFEQYQRSDLATLERRAQERPLDYDAHFMLGLKYMDAKRYIDAATQFEAAAKLSPDWYAPPLYCGEANFHLGNFVEAETFYLAAIALRAEFSFLSLAKRRLGEIREKQGRFSEARNFYLESCAAYPVALESDSRLTQLVTSHRELQPPGWQSPERDEIFHYRSRGAKPQCRLRVLSRRDEPGKLVLLTNDDTLPGPGVVNAAEEVIAQASSYLRVRIAETTWITHFEKGVIGSHSMSRISFNRVDERTFPPTVSPANFNPFTKEDLHRLTGYQLSW